jgi:RNA 2',3'-cyclic 3'-phosphodiesterase
MNMPTREPRQRLFFALWPQGEFKQKLHSAISDIALPKQLRRVPLENLHLTVLFLGLVDEKTRFCLQALNAPILVPKFMFVLDRIDYWRKPRILCLGCSKTPAPLLELVRVLRETAVNCNIGIEDREFQAHVPVARKVNKPEPSIVALDPSIEWPVDQLVLLRSINKKESVYYERVKTWELA